MTFNSVHDQMKYEQGNFSAIEIVDEGGRIIFTSCDRLEIGRWLIENKMIRVGSILCFDDPTIGVIFCFRAEVF